MSDDEGRVTSEERRAWYARAERYGGLCAACGRGLGDDETVYVEPIEVERKPLTTPGAQWSGKTARRDAPVGRECASPEFLRRTDGREPERCEGCGRGVFYRVQRAGRERALCSQRCRGRAAWARASGRQVGD